MKPRWDGRRWRIQARHEGRRVSFSSSIAGAKGRKECLRKYENWYYGEATGEKTVSKVVEEYLDDLKTRCGEHSGAYIQCECYMRLYIVSQVGQKKICKLTLRDWQKVLNEASGRNKPLSEKTLKNIRGMIMALVKYGYEDYQCEMLRGKLYIPKGHSKQEKEILQKDEVKRLFQDSKLWYHSLFTFLLVTGMRPSEALGLQLEDYEPQNDRVIIRRAVNAKGYITEGKTINAKRTIPIGDMAKSILEKTIKRNNDLNLRTKWIFCSPDGSQGNQSTMRNHWLALKKERNLHGTVYSLRHTFVSFVKYQMPVEMLKSIIGHSASMTTYETYAHMLDSDNHQAAEIIDLTFSQNVTQMSPNQK